MEELLNTRNKLLIVNGFIFLLFYTNTTISEFEVLTIKFLLNEDYLISSFNALFLIVWLYYILSFISQYSFLAKEILLLDNQFSLKKLSKKIGGVYKVFYFSMYLTSFRFLNIHITLTVTFIVWCIVMPFESILVGILIFITLTLIVKRLIKPFNNEMILLENEIISINKNYDKLIQNIDILKETNDPKVIKIFEEVEKTISNRIQKTTMKQEVLKEKMGLIK